MTSLFAIIFQGKFSRNVMLQVIIGIYLLNRSLQNKYGENSRGLSLLTHKRLRLLTHREHAVFYQ